MTRAHTPTISLGTIILVIAQLEPAV